MFSFVVNVAEKKMEKVMTAVKYKLFYFKFIEVPCLNTLLSQVEHNWTN